MAPPRVFVALGILVVACPRETSGQLALGSEIAVNLYTSANQDVPGLALLPGGGFVVAWQSALVDGDGTGVVARRFDSTGTGVGGEIALATGVAGAQNLPAIGADSAGNFVATWDSWAAPGDLSGYGVSARAFAAAGTPAGDELLVNAYTNSFQHASDIAVGAAGDFAVVWQDDGQVAEAQIYLRIFGADGSPATGEILVSDDAGYYRASPAIARDGAGNLVVAWQAEETGELHNVYYRLFAADGDPITAGTLATETVASDQKLPDVAVRPTGEFVIVWQSHLQDGDAWGIYARRFDADGDPAAGESRANLGTAGNQVEPSAGVAPDGTLVVAFLDTAHGGILGRAFDSGGTSYGGDFPISDPTPLDEASPSLAIAANGDFAVAWTADGYDGSGYSIRARRFAGDYLFRDGFESAGTQAWNGTVGALLDDGADE